MGAEAFHKIGYGDIVSGYFRNNGPLPDEPINIICKQCGHGRKDHSNKPNQIQQNGNNNWRCCGRSRIITIADNGIKRIRWDICACDLTHEEVEYNAMDESVLAVYVPSDETPLDRLK